MIVLEADAEHGVGQQLHHLPAHFEQFFFCQTNLWNFERARALADRAGKGKAAVAADPDAGSITANHGGASILMTVLTPELPATRAIGDSDSQLGRGE